MNLDPRIESKANHICHVVGENEHLKLSDKSRHDVFETVRAVAAYWRDNNDRMHKANYEGKYKEVGIFIRQNPDASVEDIKKVMLYLDMNGVQGVRNLKLRVI